MNFMKLWRDTKALNTKKWIKDTKCNCTYECAWSFNILGNAKYQKDLILAALGRNNNLSDSCAIVVPAIYVNEDVEKCLQECLEQKKLKSQSI